MSVTFVASGDFEVSAFVKTSCLPIVCEWLAGDARPVGACEHSGFSVTIHQGDESYFGLLAARATEFLQTYGAELNSLRDLPGLKRLALTFLVAQRADPAWVVRVPPQLTTLAARHGVELEFLFLSIQGMGGFGGLSNTVDREG